MAKRSNKKNGNRKILLLCGFLLLLLILLTYFRFGNNNQTKLVSVSPSITPKSQVLNEAVSYTLPVGWKTVEENESHLLVQSPDYQINGAGYISQGAQIFISTNSNAHSLTEAVEESGAPFKGEPENLTIDNKLALNLTECGDTCRNVTYILFGDNILTVGYFSSGDNISNYDRKKDMNKTIYYPQYQQLINSIKFK